MDWIDVKLILTLRLKAFLKQKPHEWLWWVTSVLKVFYSINQQRNEFFTLCVQFFLLGFKTGMSTFPSAWKARRSGQDILWNRLLILHQKLKMKWKCTNVDNKKSWHCDLNTEEFWSGQNLTKLPMTSPQLFSGWYQIILDVFRCSQLFSDVFSWVVTFMDNH